MKGEINTQNYHLLLTLPPSRRPFIHKFNSSQSLLLKRLLWLNRWPSTLETEAEVSLPMVDPLKQHWALDFWFGLPSWWSSSLGLSWINRAISGFSCAILVIVFNLVLPKPFFLSCLVFILWQRPLGLGFGSPLLVFFPSQSTAWTVCLGGWEVPSLTPWCGVPFAWQWEPETTFNLFDSLAFFVFIMFSLSVLALLLFL
jgi:hypothetical protein